MKQIEVMTAKDLAGLYGKSTSWGYQQIKKLNAELAQQGFFTVAGVAPKTYVLKRFGLCEDEVEA